MTLAALKVKLLVVSGTDILKVYFEWAEYLNENSIGKQYPLVLWSLSGSKFTKDIRTATIQKVKILTLDVFAVKDLATTEDKITVWDALEEDFDAYINAVNAMTGLSVGNIDKIEGEYFPEGLLSIESEIGIGYRIELKIFC